MKKIIIILLFLSYCSAASAERWVCQQGLNLRRFTGDGYVAGICGKNNTNIIPSCIEATLIEYNLSAQAYKKLDTNASVGSRVISWSQQEIDDAIQAEVDAQEQALLDAIDKYEISKIDLITALIKVINVRIPSNPITKQEMINQIKDDLGF